MVACEIPFPELLGLGYAGFAKVDTVFLMLTGGGAVEEDNLVKSPGAVSTEISRSVGQVPVRDRRSLAITLEAELTPSSAELVKEATLDWRRSGLLAKTHEVEISIANGEGYTTDEAYMETVAITSPQGGLCTVTFVMRAWKWTDTAGIEHPREQSAFLPFDKSEFQPIPNWDTTVEFNGQPGTPTDFSLNFNNNWYFAQLLEARKEPPDPRVITAGPLDIIFNLVTLAERGQRSLESGTPKITFGGSVKLGPKNAIPETVFDIPLVYRDPDRTLQSLGTQNGVVQWAVGWSTLGLLPD